MKGLIKGKKEPFCPGNQSCIISRKGTKGKYAYKLSLDFHL